MGHRVCGILAAGILVFSLGAAAELTPLEELGRVIFFDDNLSTPHGQACAACHAPEVGFTGPISDINAHGGVYPGAVHVRFGNRKPPAAAYNVLGPDFHYDEIEGLYVGGQFWDGRALNAVEQAKGPFLNPLEQNNPHAKQVIVKIRNSDYAVFFQEVFGWGSLMDVEAAYQHVAEAIAAYERSEEVSSFTSKYDAYLAGLASLTEAEMSGLALFEGQGNCAACHISQPGPNGEPPLFTDFTYDNLGSPKNPENPFYGMPPHFNPDGEAWIDYGLGGVLGLPEEMGKMKVPTLRNVAKVPYEGFVQCYLHNGVFKSLYEVVDFYNTRDVGSWPPPEVPENVNHDELGNLGLSEQDVDDIVAFMGTLTDGYLPEPGPRPLVLQAPNAGTGLANPFLAGGEIRFVLPEPSAVQADIFDVSGRRVRSLISGVMCPAGPNGRAWDGTGDDGMKLVSGTYFYRIEAGSHRETRRLLLLR